MQFSSRISCYPEIERMVDELTQGVEEFYDLAFLFVSGLGKAAAEELVMLLQKRIISANFIGCTCAGIISDRHEVERQSGAVLILGRTPGVKITPFFVNEVELESLKNKEDWYRFLEIYPNEKPIFLILPDPFMIDMSTFLEGVNSAYPSCPVIGGLASGSVQPQGNILILNRERFDEGLVGLALTGNITMETVVSQGCRPIGETYIVTKAQENILYEVAGRPVLEVLQDVMQRSTAKDKLLAQEAIFVGIAIDEYRHEFKRGDFLIRGLLGIDERTGAAAVGDYIKPGQTIQFHVRDAQAATEDLHELLRHKQFDLKEKPKGALVFSCNGRGENLFREKDHDIKLIQNHVGPVPAAGFFCAGEIGPICNANFLHGFTSSIALFYPKKS